MNKQIYIINGSGGVGKDTFITFVGEQSNLRIMNYSSVDKVKEVARIIGWDGSKSEQDRKFLSDLKLLCSEYNDMPFISMLEKVKLFKSSNSDILFLHIREPKEIERARVEFGAKTLLIKRKSVKHIVSNEADRDVFNYTYEIEIDNDGDIEDLCRIAKNFADDIVRGIERRKY